MRRQLLRNTSIVQLCIKHHFVLQGNTIKAVEKKKKLSSKELRKKKKDRMERRKRGEEVYTTDEELGL